MLCVYNIIYVHVYKNISLKIVLFIFLISIGRRDVFLLILSGESVVFVNF